MNLTETIETLKLNKEITEKIIEVLELIQKQQRASEKPQPHYWRASSLKYYLWSDVNRTDQPYFECPECNAARLRTIEHGEKRQCHKCNTTFVLYGNGLRIL